MISQRISNLFSTQFQQGKPLYESVLKKGGYLTHIKYQSPKKNSKQTLREKLPGLVHHSAPL